MRHTDFTFEQKQYLARLYFPDRYQSATTAKKRYNLRVAAAEQCIVNFYQSLNLSCKDCRSYSRGVCELQSDYYGTVRTTPNDICADFGERSGGSLG